MKNSLSLLNVAHNFDKAFKIKLMNHFFFFRPESWDESGLGSSFVREGGGFQGTSPSTPCMDIKAWEHLGIKDFFYLYWSKWQSHSGREWRQKSLSRSERYVAFRYDAQYHLSEEGFKNKKKKKKKSIHSPSLLNIPLGWVNGNN